MRVCVCVCVCVCVIFAHSKYCTLALGIKKHLQIIIYLKAFKIKKNIQTKC